MGFFPVLIRIIRQKAISCAIAASACPHDAALYQKMSI
jgi:hypothetical protein